jgi:hypothetical protein
LAWPPVLHSGPGAEKIQLLPGKALRRRRKTVA